MDFPKYQVAKIQENSIVIYEQYANPPSRSAAQKLAEKNLSRGLKNGALSDKAKGKISCILRTWISAVQAIRANPHKKVLAFRPYFTFVTLTLSSTQRHSDIEIRRQILTPFLQQMHRKGLFNYYFFVSEKQNNGNIHFHLLLDGYIHWRVLQNDWNHYQNNLGYIDAFEQIHGHRQPNSTDIHKLVKIRSIEAYLVKYLVKGNSKQKIEGRLWGKSEELAELKAYAEIIDYSTNEAISNLIKSKLFKVKNEDRFQLIIGKVFWWLKQNEKEFYLKISKYYSDTGYGLYSKISRKIEDKKEVENDYHQEIHCPF